MEAGTSHQRTMEEMCANISLEDEEEGGVVLEEEAVDDQAEELCWSVVGRFLTDKVINFIAMKNTLASVWRPVKGVFIKELSPTLFLFQFFHELDMQRVLENEPWTFDQHVLLCKKLETNDRMKRVLPSLISDTQSAFVLGRLITDNVMVAFEIMHFLKRKKQGKEGVATLKIDMSKAYDLIEWSFLEAMMVTMGFDDRWIRLIMMCVKSVRYYVQRVDKLLGPIVPSRGLTQGDPLSPYLFIICAEGLLSLVRRREEQGLIHGCKVARGAPSITHLYFASDSFLFFRAIEREGGSSGAGNSTNI